MAENKTKAMAMAENKSDLIKCKVIAKNQKLAKIRGGQSVIPVKLNHVAYRIVEGEVTELPANVITFLKEHKTKTLIPTGEKGFVKGKNFRTQIINAFEVVEL